ncbi:hypothetical protein G4228_016106 [Cervus hanglu yarkandensis]|nr:hypothetical protein G4228_016106 [Cervus hanglu yarkandensis]
METQRASVSLGRWSLWLLLLGLVLPSSSAQALSFREAVLRAVDQLNERSSEANLYRLLELDPPPSDDEDLGTSKPVSFTVKETVCPRTTQQSSEQCDFKENGLVKQCVGTVTLDPSNDQFDLNCNEDEDPDTPKRVSFRVKETVCSRTTQQPPEQCDFKENGLLKRCEGTVTLDQVRGNFDITCNNVEDHSARKPVSFRVKETVCPRTSLQPPEQCDFRENGLVKQCVGTVTLYQSRGDSDITCNDIQSVGIFGRLRDKIRRGGQKILDKVKRIGQRIRYFFPG